MHTFTKHITLLLLFISPLCLSCGHDIEIGYPRVRSFSYPAESSLRKYLLPDTSSKPQPHASPANHDIEMGCLQPQRDVTPSSRCTDASSTASPLMSDKSTFEVQSYLSSTITAVSQANNHKRGFRKFILSGKNGIFNIIKAFHGSDLAWFFFCTTHLHLLSRQWHHQLASPLSVESLKMKCLIETQIQAYAKLGIQVAETDIPPITSRILKEMYRLHKRSEQPLLILDLGFSIDTLQEPYIAYTDIEGFTPIYENCNRQMVIHEEVMHITRHNSQWILLPGADSGILPGSRNKGYYEQILYMNIHYVDYVAGDAREMVTVAILGALCGKQMFPGTPEATAGICSTKLEKK